MFVLVDYPSLSLFLVNKQENQNKKGRQRMTKEELFSSSAGSDKMKGLIRGVQNPI